MKNKFYLGLDTSNYTTSAALYNTLTGEVRQSKLLLPVKEGELGLRQSDAVFHHTKQLPLVLTDLFNTVVADMIQGIGVSTKPRNADGSYMPCFLCGEGFAVSLSAINNIPVYKTSHQVGHILSALCSADKLDYIKRKFLAFHISGGTTDCLLVEPADIVTDIIKITEIGTSLDLKAGQAVDRVGIMLGLKFPCGKELEALALKSNKQYKIKPVLKGINCCLSGVENLCSQMLKNGEKPADTAKFCLSYIYAAVHGMTVLALKEYGEDLPVVFAGGVMSNKFIRNKLETEFNSCFAEPEFSCDNAVGTAVFAGLNDLLGVGK